MPCSMEFYLWLLLTGMPYCTLSSGFWQVCNRGLKSRSLLPVSASEILDCYSAYFSLKDCHRSYRSRSIPTGQLLLKYIYCVSKQRSVHYCTVPHNVIVAFYKTMEYFVLPSCHLVPQTGCFNLTSQESWYFVMYFFLCSKTQKNAKENKNTKIWSKGTLHSLQFSHV